MLPKACPECDPRRRALVRTLDLACAAGLTLALASCALDDTPEPVLQAGAVVQPLDLLSVPAAADSFLRPGHRNTNEGANPYLDISQSGEGRVVVVGFDLSRLDRSAVASALLLLSIDGSSPPGNWGEGRAVNAHRLLADFVEGNGLNSMVPSRERFRGNGPGVTWSCGIDADVANHSADCATTWSGGTYDPRISASRVHTNGMLGQVAWDVTADVLSGADSWLLEREGGRGHVTYVSREGAVAIGDPSLAPSLVLELQTTCGGTCDDGDPSTIDRCNPDSNLCVHTDVPCGTAVGCVVGVPADAPTVQEAVDRVADGGVVLLAPGTYAELVRIEGKQVNLMGDWGGGAESARFELPPALPPRTLLDAEGIITYRSRGGGRLENLRLTGGVTAVLGNGGAGALGDLAIEHVTMQSNVYGMVGAWESLSLEGTSILGSAEIGFLALCSGGDHVILDSLIDVSGGVGIYELNDCNAAPRSVTVDSSIVSGNHGGALFIGNGGQPGTGNLLVSVTESVFLNNTAFGMWFHNVTPVTAGQTPALVINTDVSNTLLGDVGSLTGIGDAVLASTSSVFFLDSTFIDSARAGVFLHLDSEARFLGTTAIGELYGLVVQGNSTFLLVGEENVIEGGAQGILTDGDLPVPEPPAEPEGL